MNEFLKKLTDSGELDKLKNKWFNDNLTKKQTYKKSFKRAKTKSKFSRSTNRRAKSPNIG